MSDETLMERLIGQRRIEESYGIGDMGSAQVADLCTEAAARIRALEAQLAEARAECLEQARLCGMGSEREARLMARVAEVEKANVQAREAERAAVVAWLRGDAKHWPIPQSTALLWAAGRIEAGVHLPPPDRAAQDAVGGD